jgi:hypothetical protein
MERLEKGHLHRLGTRALETDVSRTGLKPPTSSTACVYSSKELSGQLTHLTILIRYSSLITVDGVVVVPQCLVSQCCPWVGEVGQFLSQWAQGRRLLRITPGSPLWRDLTGVLQ